ncbi:MAG: hypothetical protein ACK4YP_15180 [Myxococcota bacterium]
MFLLLLAACDTLPGSPDDTGDTGDTGGFALTSEECLALTPVSFGACYSGDTLTADSAGDYVTDIDATVVSIGRGTVPETCGWEVGNARLREGDEGLVVTLVDADGGAWTVGLDVPGLSDTFLAVGDAVSFRAVYDTNSPWVPDNRGFVLSNAQGAPLLALEDAGWIDDLPLPDIAVAPGDAVCSVIDDPCGEYFRHDIEVTVGGATGTVPFAGQADIGGLRVLHGGYDAFDGDTQCQDWIPNDIAIALLAR